MPKGSQNRSQNGPKSIITFNVEKVPLEDLLGTVLWRSWCVFGAISGSKNIEKPIVFICFFENQLFDKNRVPRGVLEPTWGQLGRPRGPKWDPNGNQKGPKSHTKNHHKKISIVGAHRTGGEGVRGKSRDLGSPLLARLYK